MSTSGHGAADPAAVQYWEERYQAKEQIWSGRVNPVLARIVDTLIPGRALDLGCGEGADSIWLAERGWNVTAVDISTTALSRAAARAAEPGVAGRITFEQHDLATSFPTGAYDLVSAQFLQTPLEFPKDQVLRAAAAHVAPGGLLLIVEHGAMPPWSRIGARTMGNGATDEHVDHGRTGDENGAQENGAHDHGDHGHDHHGVLPTPQETLDSMALDMTVWQIEELGSPSRDAIGPGGEAAVLVDNVVSVRRGA